MTLTTFIYGQKSSYDFSFQLGSAFSNLDVGATFVDNQPNFYQAQSHKLSYNIELGYNYKITNQFRIKTGLNYTTQGYTTYSPDSLDIDIFIKESVDFTFVGVPLLLRYEISNRMVSPYIEVGPSVRVLARSTYNNGMEISTTTNQYSRLNVFGRAALGLNVTLSSQAQIFGAVNYTRQINNLWQEGFTERLYGQSLQLGMRVKFGSQSRCCRPKSCCPKSSPACCPDSSKSCEEKN